MTEGESPGEMCGIRISAIEHGLGIRALPRRVGAKVEDFGLVGRVGEFLRSALSLSDYRASRRHARFSLPFSAQAA